MKKIKSALFPVRISRLLSRLRSAGSLLRQDPIRFRISVLERLPRVKRGLEKTAQIWQPQFSKPPRISSLDVLKLRFLLVAGQERTVADFLSTVTCPPATARALAREYDTILGVVARKNALNIDRMFFFTFVCRAWLALREKPAREDQIALSRSLLSAVIDGKTHNKLAIVEGLTNHLFNNEKSHQGGSQTRRTAATGTVSAEAYENLFNAFLYATLIGSETQGPRHPLFDKQFSIEFQENLSQRLQPWRQSRFYLDMVRSDEIRRQERETAIGSPRKPGPIRVLIVAENWNFAAPLLSHLANAGLEVRSFSFEDFKAKMEAIHGQGHFYLPEDFLPPKDRVRSQVASLAPLLDELIAWSDVVMTDWCKRVALWLSRYLRDDKKLVVRLHSQEAFSSWPYSMNWGGIDGMIYVADTVRRFTKAQHGERMSAVREITLPNVNRCQSRPPSLAEEERSFVIGMAGYSTANKNPVMALEVLRSLRREDERWRLRLIGHPWQSADKLSEAEKAHRRRFMELLEDPLILEGVTLEPFSDAVEDWFGSIGFTLSCSEREGTHEAAVEGMSRGAVPILRNWPMVRKFGGPAAVFPGLDHLVFEDVDNAAAIVKREHQRFTQASSRAGEYFLENFAPEVVAPKYATFLREIAASEEKMDCVPLQAVQNSEVGNS